MMETAKGKLGRRMGEKENEPEELCPVASDCERVAKMSVVCGNTLELTAKAARRRCRAV